MARLRFPLAAVRSLAIAARLLEHRPVDLCIQHGSEYVLPPGIPFVTYEDSTLAQARSAYPWPHLKGMSDRDFRSFARRQRWIYRRASACCTMSQWAADSIVADYGIPIEKVHVVGVGANHDLEPPVARHWWPPRFLFVGSDWHRKNGDRLLEAFGAVRQNHPEATLDIVGVHPEISRDGVKTHGFLSLANPADRSTLDELFGRATVLVAPSVHDPSPVVHVEAGNAGIGSIGTNSGGAATVIGAGGVLVDPLEVEALVTAMMNMCDPDTARQAGKAAQVRAAQLTWRKVAERLIRAADIPGVALDRLATFL
jgi:glycosyltransferase involved in cell wall biosynthesis